MKKSVDRDDLQVREKLVERPCHPALERGLGERATGASAAQLHRHLIAFNPDQGDRAMMVLLDVSADLVNQAGNFFFP